MNRSYIPKVILAEESLEACVRGKKIALMVNATAVHNDGRLLIDIIAGCKETEISFILGMEHGVRCGFSAGERDTESIDQRTGIPILSLYDYPERRPPVSELSRVDAVVYCTQDSGVRHWTFTPWLFYLMDSAAMAGCEVIIVDRPNPIGDTVEGNLVEEKYKSTLLSGFGYPLRHGMTLGELALMYKATAGLDLSLKVLPMEGYTRDMLFSDTGLPFIPPTPNVPSPDTFMYFALVGLLQSSNLSLGGRTSFPFRFIGHKDISADALSEYLLRADLSDVSFLPYVCDSASRWEPDNIHRTEGVIAYFHDLRHARPVRAQLYLLDAIATLYPDIIDLEWKPSWARRRMGTDDIYTLIERGESVLSLLDRWDADSKKFREMREEFLIYR